MSFTVAIAQINPVVGSFNRNRELVLGHIARAQQSGADVVLFPELALTAYPPEDLLFRPAYLKRVESELELIAREVSGISVVIGAPLQRRMKSGVFGLFNMACVLEEGRIVAEYAKQHLPNYRVFDERRYFRRGKHFAKQSPLVTIAGRHIALLICEDIWMEGPIQKASQSGAEAVFVLNASPYRIDKTDERLGLLQRHSKKHQLPIVYANLIGGQDELIFDGESLVFDPAGQLILQAPQFEQGLFTLELPFTKSATAVLPVSPGTSDDPDLKQEKIYQALVLGVRDYVEKNGFNGVILGLSGGIDSALTLAIAVDALGAENVEAIMMPFRYTSRMSVDDARKQAENLGVTYREIPIEAIFNSFMDALQVEFEGLERDVTEENIQARSRGVILMAISNKLGKMLLATGNKSEMAVGYATLYGDMAGGFAPLKDVFKTSVYALSRYRNKAGDGFGTSTRLYREIIPERVITRPPSAELAPDQLDEDSLPPYDILDDVLRQFIEEFRSVDDIVASGHDRETIKRVANLVLLNEYKRRQAAPGIRITKRAFGRDRRYPITSHYRFHLDETSSDNPEGTEQPSGDKRLTTGTQPDA